MKKFILLLFLLTIPLAFGITSYKISDSVKPYSSVFTSQRYVYKYHNYYWSLHYNNSEVYIWSSPDGETWTRQSALSSTAGVPPATTRYAGGWNTTFLGAMIGNPNSAYYREFTLNEDGTVTPVQTPQDFVVTNGLADGYMGVAFDSESYPYIVGIDSQYNQGSTHPLVFRGSGMNLSNPSWVNEDFTAHPPLPPYASVRTQPFLITLDNRDMYLIYTIVHTGRADSKDMYGVFFNGSTLAFETPLEIVNDDMYNANNYYSYGGVRNLSGNMHLVFIDTGNRIHHISAVNSSRTLDWQEHSTDLTGGNANRVALTIDRSNNDMYMVWQNSSSMYYMTYKDGVWGESEHIITVGTLYPMSIAQEIYDGELLITYSNGSGAPYSRQFISITVSDPCACPSSPQDFTILDGCTIGDCDIRPYRANLDCSDRVEFTGILKAGSLGILSGCSPYFNGGSVSIGQ